jgi:hypothetical protein
MGNYIILLLYKHGILHIILCNNDSYLSHKNVSQTRLRLSHQPIMGTDWN